MLVSYNVGYLSKYDIIQERKQSMLLLRYACSGVSGGGGKGSYRL